jgi:hypothetical protein
LPLRSARTTSRHPAKWDGGSRRDDPGTTAHDANIANRRCRVKTLARQGPRSGFVSQLIVPAKDDRIELILPRH